MRVQLHCSAGKIFHGEIPNTIYDAIMWRGRTFVYMGITMRFRGGDELRLYEEVVPFAVADDTMTEGKYPGIIEGIIPA
jgi:hypothetical protein